MESSTQLPSASTAENFEYKYWYWKMYEYRKKGQVRALLQI